MSAALTTLPMLLAARAAEDPDAVVAVFGERRVTAGELDARAAAVAAGLARLGVQEGDAVAVWLPSTPTWLEVHFALARLGAILVSVNTRYRSFDLGAVLAGARARWLVLQPRFRSIDFVKVLTDADAERCASLDGVVLDGDVPERLPHGLPGTTYRALDARGAAYEQPSGALADRGVIAFPSSGSTGVPKLVMHGQRNIVRHAQAVGQQYFGAPDATALVALPLCGVFGYTTFMGALAAGRPAIVMDAFDPAAAVGLIERHAITTVTGPDVVHVSLLEAATQPGQLASWREGAFSVQAADNVDLVRRGDAVGVELFQSYGSSEFLGLLTRQPPGAAPDKRALAGGVPVSPDLRVRIRSVDDGTLLDEPGATGLIELKGPSFMLGYLHDPRRTAEALTEDGWFKTGDLGYRTGEGERFVFLSRANDALRLGGFLVEPREIERFIERCEGVAAAQVVAVPSKKGPQPVAFVLADDGTEIDEGAIVEACAAALAPYKVPRRVFVVDAYPVTTSPNGEKVQRAKLREHAVAMMAEGAAR